MSSTFRKLSLVIFYYQRINILGISRGWSNDLKHLLVRISFLAFVMDNYFFTLESSAVKLFNHFSQSNFFVNIQFTSTFRQIVFVTFIQLCIGHPDTYCLLPLLAHRAVDGEMWRGQTRSSKIEKKIYLRSPSSVGCKIGVLSGDVPFIFPVSRTLTIIS